MKDLGTLGGTQSFAYAINDLSEVIGYSYTSNGAQDAFLYEGGVMLDLNSLLPVGSGWSLTAAYGINDAGDIVGTGTYNGQTFAVELSPGAGTTSVHSAVPEPTTILLVGVGLVGAAKISRRSKS